MILETEKKLEDKDKKKSTQEHVIIRSNTPKRDMRTFIINGTQQKKFVNNSIKTAKYNVLTFLPLATIYQFNNYFNIFFLISAVICSITLISPLDPATALTPFLFVIIISLIREAIEDFKKSKYDKIYNNSPTLCWNSTDQSFMKIKWADANVGNILKINKNEIIPCDVLVIKSSAENGFCYLETTNLDGESALKPREAMVIVSTLLLKESDLNNVHGSVEVDHPNNDIYRLEGTLFLEGYERSMFDINNVLLRGGRLKNVDHVYGIVLYTGKETKIMKNIKNGSLKLSSIDVQLNNVVIYIMLIVMLICFVCTMFGAFFRSKNLPDYENNQLNSEYILYYNKNKPGESRNDVLETVRIFAGLFIMFNTLIPISLMISYQVVKGLQILFMQLDPLLAEDPVNDKMKALSFTLHEDLGMVKYIFTDKTGTLTRNEMELYACSIFTKPFDNEEEEEDDKDNILFNNHENMTHQESQSYSKNIFQNVEPSVNKSSTIQNTNKKIKKSTIAITLDKSKFIDCLTNDTLLNIHDIKNCPFKSYREAIIEFFLNITLNHNVLTEIDSQTGEVQFQGSNPDEVTLVTSAAELGIEFIAREGNTIRVRILDKIEKFDVIQKFEFTSSRMRSSIIVRDAYGNHKLYMKGADTKIFAKIDKFSIDNLYERSKSHLDSFAKRGLRTLCYSYKILNESELMEWETEYKELKYQAINNKNLEAEVEKQIIKLEEDLTLLGVSALEDKLQEGVKNDLQNFIEAGIDVWMITGDKMDTAESIGYSCKLFNKDTEVFKIKKDQKPENTKKRMQEILEKMNQFQKEVEDFKNKKNKNDGQKNQSENEKADKKSTQLQLNTDSKTDRKIMNDKEILERTFNNDKIKASSNKISTTLNKPNFQIATSQYPQFNKRLENTSDILQIFNDVEKHGEEFEKNYKTEMRKSVLKEEKIQKSELKKSNEYETSPLGKLIPENEKKEACSSNLVMNVNSNSNSDLINVNQIQVKSNSSLFKIKISDEVIKDENPINFQSNNKLQNAESEREILVNKKLSIYNHLPKSAYSRKDINELKRLGTGKGERSKSNTRSNLRGRLNTIQTPELILKKKEFDEISKLNLQEIDDQTILNFIIEKNLENSSMNDGNSMTFLKKLHARRKNSDASNSNNNFQGKIILNFNNNININYFGSENFGSFKKEDMLHLEKNNLDHFDENSNPDEAKSDSKEANEISGNPKENNHIKNLFPMSNLDKKDTNIQIDPNRIENKMNSHRDVTFNVPIQDSKAEKVNFKQLNHSHREKTNLKIKTDFKHNETNRKRSKKTKGLLKNGRSKTTMNIDSKNIDYDSFPKIEPFSPKFYKNKTKDFHNVMNYLEDQIEKIDSRKKSLIPLPIFNRKKPTEEENDMRNFLINFGLIIEGESIDHCLLEDSADLFWNLIKKSRSVVACRCSPLQKSMIVSFVKKRSKRVTLAIGDGGNDVNMIKTANIGIGIFGKEGYQAAYSSDFAISQFKYLKRLIFNHGRFSLERNSYFVYFFFFKNIIFSIPQFWLCFFSGFSGVNYYDQWFYLGYNSFMTTFPVGARALVEEDIDLDTKKQPESRINKTFLPDIYNEYRESNPFNIAKFFMVFVSAFGISLFVYFIPYFNYKLGILDSTGRASTYWDHSLSSFLAVVTIHFLFLFEDTSLNTWFNTGVYALQLIIIISFMLIHNLRNAGELSGVIPDVVQTLNFWLISLLTIACCVVPFFIVRRVEFFYSETIINNLRKKNYQDDFKKKYLVKGLEGMSKNLRYVVKFKKILQGAEIEDDNYANKRVKELVEQFQSSRKIKRGGANKKMEGIILEFENAKKLKKSVSSVNPYYKTEVAYIKNKNDDYFNRVDDPVRSTQAIELQINVNTVASPQKKIKQEYNKDSNSRDR